MTPLRPHPRPIDPFAATEAGLYQDDVVTVVRRECLRPADGERWSGVTGHFAVGTLGGRRAVWHALPVHRLDNDLAALIADELFAPGWVTGADTFERVLTGIVLSGADDALLAWQRFYQATLDRLDALLLEPDAAPPPDAPEGSLAGFAPVYRRAEELLAAVSTATLLDLGSCFGFFPLRVAGPPGAPTVSAPDVTAGTVELLERVSRRLGRPLEVLLCDAAACPGRTARSTP